jgi:hypothetical protein
MKKSAKILSLQTKEERVKSCSTMAPNLTEEEIDDLVYFARVGEDADLTETLTALSEREKASPAEILLAAKDEGKSTTLHMAAGNGHLGKKLSYTFFESSLFSISCQTASVVLAMKASGS